jgi:class 3 adenylate cyclase
VIDPPELEYVKTDDGLHLAYHVGGVGPPDVLLMMSSAFPVQDQMEGSECRRFLRRLEGFSRVIRFDRRGIGNSDPVRSFDEHVYELWVEDTLTVLDAVGSEDVAVFGGEPAACMAPILLAATHPNRVSRLMLYNPIVRPLAAADYPHGVPSDEAQGSVENYVQSLVTGSHLDTVGFQEPSVGDRDDFHRWLLRSRRNGASPAVARAIFANWLNTDLRSVLPTVSVPTLVLHSSAEPNRPPAGSIRASGILASRVVDPAVVTYVADHIRNARYVEIAGDESFIFLGDVDSLVREVEQFITGTTTAPVPDSLLATVLFTDIVDSTAQSAAYGDHAWGERLDDHDTMVRDQLERFRGREIKTTGDGFLAIFDGPARAIHCACAIRDAAKQLGIDIRAGLHTGEIQHRERDIAGVAVNVGARVCTAAAPGEVLVSRTVVDLVAGSGIHFHNRGDHQLKGIPQLWQLFAVER